jgi:hypothetical protein
MSVSRIRVVLLLSVVCLYMLGVDTAPHVVHNEERNEQVVITPNCTVEKDVDHVNKAKMIMEKSVTLYSSSPILRKEDCTFKCAHKSGCTHAAYNNVSLICTLLSHSQAKIPSVKTLEMLPVYTSIVKVTCFDDEYCLKNPDSPICSGRIIADTLKGSSRRKRAIQPSVVLPSEQALATTNQPEVTTVNITECLNDTLTITMYCCWTEVFDASCAKKKSVITFDRFQTKNSCVYQCAASGQCTAAVYDEESKKCSLYIGSDHCSADVNSPKLHSSVLLSAKCNRDHQPTCGKEITTTEGPTTPAPCSPRHFVDLSDIEDNMIIEPNGTVHYNQTIGILRIDFDEMMGVSAVGLTQNGIKQALSMQVFFADNDKQPEVTDLAGGHQDYQYLDVISVVIRTKDNTPFDEKTIIVIENCNGLNLKNPFATSVIPIDNAAMTEQPTSEPPRLCYICLKGEDFGDKDVFSIKDGSAAEIDSNGVISIAFSHAQELQMIWAKTKTHNYHLFARLYENNELLSEIALQNSDTELAYTMVLATDALVTRAEVYVKEVQDSDSKTKREDTFGVIDDICMDSCVNASNEKPILTTYSSESSVTTVSVPAVTVPVEQCNYKITEKMFNDSGDGSINFADGTQVEIDQAMYISYVEPKEIFAIHITVPNCGIRIQAQLIDVHNRTHARTLNCKAGELAVTRTDDLTGPFVEILIGLEEPSVHVTTSTFTELVVVICKDEGTTQPPGTPEGISTSAEGSTTPGEGPSTPDNFYDDTCKKIDINATSLAASTNNELEFEDDVTVKLTKSKVLKVNIPNNGRVQAIGLQKDEQEPKFQVVLINSDTENSEMPVRLHSGKDDIEGTNMRAINVEDLIIQKEGEGGITADDFTRLVIVICESSEVPPGPQVPQDAQRGSSDTSTTEEPEIYNTATVGEDVTFVITTTTTVEPSTSTSTTTTEEPTTSSSTTTTTEAPTTSTTTTTEEPTTSTSTTTTEEPTTTSSTTTTEEPTTSTSTTTTEEPTTTSSTTTTTTVEPTTSTSTTTTEEPTTTSSTTTTEEPTTTSSTTTTTTTEAPTTTSSTTTTEEPTTSTSTTTTTEQPTTTMLEPECQLEEDPCSIITVIHKTKGAMQFHICGDHGKCVPYGDSITGKSFECECFGSYTGDRCNICDTCENPTGLNDKAQQLIETSSESASELTSLETSSEEQTSIEPKVTSSRYVTRGRRSGELRNDTISATENTILDIQESNENSGRNMTFTSAAYSSESDESLGMIDDESDSNEK